MSDRLRLDMHEGANAPLLASRRHGRLYDRIESVTPTPVKVGAKRCYYAGRRRYDRWSFVEAGRFAEFGRSFRYDRAEPYSTRVGPRTIVEDFNVWNACLGGITAGSNCWFGLHNVVMGPVDIGDYLSTGQFVAILGPRKPSPQESRLRRNKTVIGRNVWISTGAIVLFGVSIGDNAVVSAGAVVSEDIPANTLYAQRPKGLYLPLDETQIRRPED